MPAPVGTMTTYQEVNLREHLLDELTDISPDRNPLSTVLPVIDAHQRVLEWGEYYLSRKNSVAPVIEGDDASFADLTQQVRYANYLQTIRETFVVSESNIAADKISPRDAYAREMGNAMSGYKNAEEFALLRGSLICGSSGVGRGMRGIRNWTLDLGVATRVSGVSLAESHFNDAELASWNVTDEKVFDWVLVNGRFKQRISGFTAGVTKNVEASDKRLVRSVDVYEGDFGMHEIIPHKDMMSGELLGIRKDLLAKAYLRKPKNYEIARTGSARKGMIEGEVTLKVGSPRPNILWWGML